MLVRHVVSIRKLENKFIGSTDVELSENGLRETTMVTKFLRENGIEFDGEPIHHVLNTSLEL